MYADVWGGVLLGVSVGGVLLGVLGWSASGSSQDGAILGVSRSGGLLMVAGGGILLRVCRMERFYWFLVVSRDGALLEVSEVGTCGVMKRRTKTTRTLGSSRPTSPAIHAPCYSHSISFTGRLL